MTSLEQLLKSLEDARLNATQGEWRFFESQDARPHEIYALNYKIGEISHYGSLNGEFSGSQLNNIKFMAISANHIMQLIEIIRVQKEALDKAVDPENMTHFLGCAMAEDDEECFCGTADRAQAFRECNARVEAIAKKGIE